MFSRILYRGVKLIASYPDIRLRETIKQSILHLENNNSILIFPEDSSSGYKDEIDSFHEGFIYLAKAYEKKHGVAVPIVPVYFHKEKHVIIMGESYVINHEKTRQDISNDFRVIVNNLVNQINV